MTLLAFSLIPVLREVDEGVGADGLRGQGQIHA
jgi:hypothetical protein